MTGMMFWFSLLVLLLTPGQGERRSPGLNDGLTLDGARPILDNARVTVWDFSWTRGVPQAMDRATSNAVWITVAPVEGQAVYWPKGEARHASPSATPARTIVINLKDSGPATMVNKTAYPNAFPRPGIKKVLENDRVIVWDYTWTTGQPTPMHFHDKDTVVVYLRDGSLKSTTPDGQSVVNPLTVGKTTFNARDRVHSETLVEGESRAIITELK
jgi:hypothetical protein